MVSGNKSVLIQKALNVHEIVGRVDNASHDGSVRVIASLKPRMRPAVAVATHCDQVSSTSGANGSNSCVAVGENSRRLHVMWFVHQSEQNW